MIWPPLYPPGPKVALNLPQIEPIEVPEAAAVRLLLDDALRRWYAEQEVRRQECLGHLGLDVDDARRLSAAGRLLHVVRPNGVAEDVILPTEAEHGQHLALPWPAGTIVLIRYITQPNGPVHMDVWPDGKPDRNHG